MAKTKMHQGTGNRSREEGPAPILYDIQNRIKNVPLKSLLGSIFWTIPILQYKQKIAIILAIAIAMVQLIAGVATPLSCIRECISTNIVLFIQCDSVLIGTACKVSTEN